MLFRSSAVRALVVGSQLEAAGRPAHGDPIDDIDVLDGVGGNARRQQRGDVPVEVRDEPGRRLLFDPTQRLASLSVLVELRSTPVMPGEVSRSEEHTSELQSLIRTSYA